MSRLRAATAALLIALAALPAPAADRPRARPPADAPGPVCDDAAITGQALPAIAGADGCGILHPVEVTSVAGVALVPPPVLSCGTARALRAWVTRAAKPGFPRRLEALQLAAGYTCRPRNNQPGAKVSEHAAGHAIDVAGFRLADGTAISVAGDWGGPAWGATLRQIHAAACGTFSTTLGPGADSFHASHLHYDIERRNGRPFCQ